MADAIRALCCWCGGALGQGQVKDLVCWLCPVCFRRQTAHALVVTIKGQADKCLHVPLPKQVMFRECRAKNILWGGAAGPGKSTGVRWWLYHQCLTIPGFEALLLRETSPQLRQTHLRCMEREQASLGARLGATEGVMRFPNGSLIQCGHMEDVAAVQNYLSTEYDAIVADEGSQYPVDPEGSVPLLELSTRARSNKPEVRAQGGAKFIVASNPGGPSSLALMDFFIDHTPDFEKCPALRENYDPAQWAYIPATLDDNPYIDPDYLQTLAVLQPWRYEQLRHGNWRVFSGQFFSQWEESRHVKDLTLDPATVRWFRSLDWGRNQPGCVGWWATLPDHRHYRRKEWKFQGMSEPEVAAGIAKIDKQLGLPKHVLTVADPSIQNKTGATHKDGRFVGQSIQETLAHYGIPTVLADNDRFNGWARCQAMLRDAPDGMPWMLVHPECRYFIRSVASARSDKNDPDDVDTRSDDHALDEWRYYAMSRPAPYVATRMTRFAAGTMGELRLSAQRRPVGLGSESVRHANA